MTMTTEQRTCERHGAYEAFSWARDRWSQCPKCAEEENAREAAHQAARARESKIANALQASGIAPRYWNATLASFDPSTPAQREVLDACRAAAARIADGECDGSGLFLIGPPGTGKTHLGCAMVRAVIEARATCSRIISARAIVCRLRATWRRDSDETEEAVIEDFASLAVLVVDEVGIGFGTEGEQVQLFDVLDARYRHRQPTVILSNLNHPALRQSLGDRLYDRLREGAQTLVCDWASYRGRHP